MTEDKKKFLLRLQPVLWDYIKREEKRRNDAGEVISLNGVINSIVLEHKNANPKEIL